LNGKEAPLLLQNYLQDKLRDLDIVWKDATYLGRDAFPAYNHIVDDLGAGSGGVSMFVAPKLRHLIRKTNALHHN
jgi:hypothetical protein